MKHALSLLPCFNQIESISTITSGLSQHCFKVNADNNVYFAKTINDNTETSVTAYAGKSGLSPNITYHDQDWLICRFIKADNLTQSALPIDDKIYYALTLMVKCHQLSVKPPELSPKGIINSLLNNSHYSTLQKTTLLALADLIIVPINNNKNGVCCHGDLNFSNVLINVEQRTWLVDYECACTAPIEYDLAMCIAVNGLTDKTSIIIEQYQIYSSVKIDLLLLNAYLLFCSFINALWYCNTYHEKAQPEECMSENKLALLKHAQQQWSAFQSLLKTNDSPLLNRLSIKLTNILPALNFKNQT